MNKSKILLLFVSLFFLCAGQCAKAEFVYSPLINVIYAEDGTGDSTVFITNPFQNEARVQLSVADWDLDLFEISDQAVKEYIKLSPRLLILPPGKSREVKIAVKLPKKLKNKEYKAFLQMREIGIDRRKLKKEEIDQAKLNLSVNKQINSAIYIHKGKVEDLKDKFEVVKVKTEKFDSAIGITLSYQNTGNIQTRKNISINFYDPESSDLIGKVENFYTLVSFPQSTDEISAKSFKLKLPKRKLNKLNSYLVELVFSPLNPSKYNDSKKVVKTDLLEVI